MGALLCGIFFVTGAASLAFEALWFHQTGLALGSSVWATSLVLAGFMGGLAVGNAVAARVGDRLPHPLRTYAALEAGVAVTGIALVYALPGVGGALARVFGPLLEQPWVVNPLRFAVAFGLLLVPSTAMGATLPLLTQVLAAREPSFGAILGRLYGWNTLGAVAGVLVAEFALIDGLGIRGTALAAGAAGLAAAGAAMLVATRLTTPGAPAPIDPPAPAETARTVAETNGGVAPWVAAAFVSGFALLALEVVWFRFLLLYVVSESSSFAAMLAVVLAGIATGGLVGGALLRRDPVFAEWAAPVAALAAVCGVVSYAAVPFVWSDPTRTANSGGELLRLALPLMFPVSLLSGVLFTVLGAALRRAAPSAARAAGSLAFANTLGAALGSLVAGFALLPLLGMERSLFALCALYLALAAALLLAGGAARRVGWAGCAAALVAAALFPFGAMRDVHLRGSVERHLGPGGGVLVGVRETPTETIAYLENHAFGEPHSHRLITNGYSMSASYVTARRYMKLYVYWPAALHPELESALLISYGVGSTAKALTDTESLRRIDVVDISRDVLEMSDLVHPVASEHPLRDPRVAVHIEDGRYYLEASERRYDLITGEPPPPNVRGVVNLYTREHFERVHRRLAPGGIATYWLPIQSLSDRATLSILRGFCDAFADCSLWHGMGGNLMMVGTRDATGPVDATHFAAQWQRPRVAAEMAGLGFEDPGQLGALFIGDAAWLERLTRNIPPLTDDFPKRVLATDNANERYPPLRERFWDVVAARERFTQSPLIARLWPAPWREAALDWFETQALINQFGNRFFVERDSPFPELHEVLTGSRLRAPALWMLGADADLGPVLDRVLARDPAHPEAHYFRGVHHLAAREWSAAAEVFAVAESAPNVARNAFRYRVYALCMAGRCEEAAASARARYVRVAPDQSLPPFWLWMRDTFSLDPRPPTALSRR